MANRLTTEQIEKMREQFLGKRIAVEDRKGSRWVGTCEFLGYNDYLPSWEFQVTLDRMPISHVKPDSIKLI